MSVITDDSKVVDNVVDVARVPITRGVVVSMSAVAGVSGVSSDVPVVVIVVLLVVLHVVCVGLEVFVSGVAVDKELLSNMSGVVFIFADMVVCGGNIVVKSVL